MFILAFSPDNIHLASLGSGGDLLIWDTLIGRMVEVARRVPGSRMTSVAFSSSGASVVTGSDDSKAYLWTLLGEQPSMEIAIREDEESVDNVAFLPGDDRVLLASGGRFLVWDLKQKALSQSFAVSEGLREAVLSPDGRLAAYWSNVQDSGLSALFKESSEKVTTIHLVRVEEKAEVGTLQHPGRVVALGFTSDGAQMATVSQHRDLRLWDVEAVKQASLSASSASNTFTARSLSFNGTRAVIDLHAKGQIVWDVPGRRIAAETSEISDTGICVLSKDGTRLVTLSNLPKTPDPAPIGSDDSDATSSSSSDEGSSTHQSASGNETSDGTSEKDLSNLGLCVWDATNLTRVRNIPLGSSDAILNICLSSDAALVAVYVKRREEDSISTSFIDVFEVESGERIHALVIAGSVGGMTFSEGGDRLFACSQDDNTSASRIDSWDAHTGTLLSSKPVNSCNASHKCELLTHPDNTISHRGSAATSVCRGDTLELVEMWLHLKNGLVQVQPDGTQSFLEIRGSWLYVFNSELEWRLCWMPPQWRVPLRKQLDAVWKGSYLVLRNRDGAVAVLDVECLRKQVQSRPCTKREAVKSASDYTSIDDRFKGSGGTCCCIIV